MVQVLRGNGGVAGLKTVRVEAATRTLMKQLLPSKAPGGGVLSSDRCDKYTRSDTLALMANSESMFTM